jgi:hypothetical protein
VFHHAAFLHLSTGPHLAAFFYGEILLSKALRSGAFTNSCPNVSGLSSNYWETHLEDTDDFADIWSVAWWKHHCSAGANGCVLEGDLVRLIATDKSFDIVVSVERVLPGGAEVHLYHGRLPEDIAGLDAYEIRRRYTKNEADFSLVKMDHEGKPFVRVEYLPASKWRVVGDDRQVVAESIISKSEADKRLSKYLFDMNLRMPAPGEMAKHVQDILAKEAEQAKVTARKQPNRPAAA